MALLRCYGITGGNLADSIYQCSDVSMVRRVQQVMGFPRCGAPRCWGMQLAAIELQRREALLSCKMLQCSHSVACGKVCIPQCSAQQLKGLAHEKDILGAEISFGR